MRFHILTLFPDMVMDGLHTSILGRAMESGSISAEAINIRDYSEDKHNHVDDTPYGGGAGMVMQAGPVYRAFEDLCAKLGKRPRVIYTTPQGRVFSQSIAEELAKEEDLVFLCGHYEGIDERALELVATDYLSIGDYVLTGGELPAMVMIDSISRLVPGVLNNETSAEFESFHDNLLEYPHYTRPETFMGKRVPEVLLTGHHKNIDAWRRKKSVERTLERRPELLKDAVLSAKEKEYLRELLEKQNAERKERAAGVCPESAGSVSLALRGAWEVIDLTQEIREDMPMFPGDEPPVLEHVASCGRDGYRETKLTFYSHTGTHADAPSHIADGRTRLEQFSLSHFIGQAFTIDASGLAEGESITIRATLEERSFSLDAEYAPRPRFTFRSSARLKFTDRYSVLALAERGRTLADLFDGMNAAYERTMREELERIARDSLGEDDYLGYRTRLYRADPDAYRESGGSLDGAELIFDIKAEVV